MLESKNGQQQRPWRVLWLLNGIIRIVVGGWLAGGGLVPAPGQRAGGGQAVAKRWPDDWAGDGNAVDRRCASGPGLAAARQGVRDRTERAG